MHSYNQIVQAYMNNPYSRVVEIGNFSDISKYYERDYYITTNY
jgi:hypothetical protein